MSGYWTPRRNRTMLGIRGVDDQETLIPTLPTIGRLHKGGPMREVKKSGRTYRIMGEDLDHFRFTSEREEVAKAFLEAYGEQPKVITCYLPYPTADENFQTCCEEWVAGGLVHRCDGKMMTIWRDEHGAMHVAPPAQPIPCPYDTGDKQRTDKQPGCRWVGRLYVIVPELIGAGFGGLVSLVVSSKNDILRIKASLRAIEEERRGEGSDWPLRYMLVTVRRVPERISTPGDDGGRVRRSTHLVVVEPVTSWLQAQLQAAREEYEPAALPAPHQEPDWEDATTNGRTVGEVEREKKEAAERRQTTAAQVVEGQVAEVTEAEAEEILKEAEQSAPGFAAETCLTADPPAEASAQAGRQVDRNPLDEADMASEDAAFQEDAHAWLEALKERAADAGATDSPPASQKQKAYAAMLLRQCWPHMSDGTAVDAVRRQFTSMALPKAGRLSAANTAEASALIEALKEADGPDFDPVAAAYVRLLVQEATVPAGRQEASAGQGPLFPAEEVLDA